MSPNRNQGRVVPVTNSGLATNRLTSVINVPREIRSRRKRWLEQNPDYFGSASADLELSDPLTYDRLIRQHQTAAERESEGRKRGWAATLESSLLRSEAKLAQADPTNPKYGGGKPKSASVSKQAQRKGPKIDWTVENIDIEEELNEQKNSTEGNDDDEVSSEQNNTTTKTDPKSRRIGQTSWHNLLAQRFIDGYDDEFDYLTVDKDETLDEDWTGQRSQENWFEEEEERLEGRDCETGIQDF